MLRKIISLFIVMTLFTVQAQASVHDGLKAAFDELNYALTVEWDQKDKAVYESEMKKFMATVRDLQKNGLSNDEMMAFAKSQVKDARVAKDLETAFTMITINKMNSEEASKFMMDTMKRSYSKGAAWSQDASAYLIVGIIIVAVAVAVAVGGNVVVTGGGYYGGGYGGCYSDCYYYDYGCGYDWYGWPQYCTGYTCDEYCY